MEFFDNRLSTNQPLEISMPTTQMDLNNPNDVSEVRLDIDYEDNNSIGRRL